MSILPGFPGLEGLYELDQKGVDIRPTLLRVLTDQYVSSPHHTPEEERQYTELALRLIDETDIATRAVVSARLARHPAAPRPIILQLARDVLEVAEPILKFSSGLTPDDCCAIVDERGPNYAELIAERGRASESAAPPLPAVPPAPARITSPAPGRQPELATPHFVHPNQGLAPDTVPAASKAAVVADDPEATELCELFFAAGSPERRLILLTLDYSLSEPLPPRAILQRADVWRIETAALTRNAPVIAREFEQALGVSTTLARRIVNDEQGEPLVVAAKAMEMPSDVVQRMLLFMNPTVGQSVDRVYALSDLHAEISVNAARRLVSIWCDAAQPQMAQEAADDKIWRNVADSARRALAEISRPQSAPRDAFSGQGDAAQAQGGRR
jgi:hypothetical protein